MKLDKILTKIYVSENTCLCILFADKIGSKSERQGSTISTAVVRKYFEFFGLIFENFRNWQEYSDGS